MPFTSPAICTCSAPDSASNEPLNSYFCRQTRLLCPSFLFSLAPLPIPFPAYFLYLGFGILDDSPQRNLCPSIYEVEFLLLSFSESDNQLRLHIVPTWSCLWVLFPALLITPLWGVSLNCLLLSSFSLQTFYFTCCNSRFVCKPHSTLSAVASS